MDDFLEIVGQQRVKGQLNFCLESFRKNGIVQPLVITGPKGQGKTSIARAFSRRLINPNTNKPKLFVEINCASLKNATVVSFFEQIVNKYIVDNYVTLFFDEASEISREISMMFLTILDPENHTSMTFTRGDYSAEFDLRKITWIFATSEPHLIFHSLFDRFEQIALQDYSGEDLAEIIGRFLDKQKINYDKSTLLSVSEVCRGNGRNAVMWGKRLAIRANSNGNYVDDQLWENLKKDLKVLPKGLSEQEINLLKILKDSGQCSLTKLCAKTGFSQQALRRTIETYLLKLNYIEIETPAGRKITEDGMKYLANYVQD